MLFHFLLVPQHIQATQQSKFFFRFRCCTVCCEVIDNQLPFIKKNVFLVCPLVKVIFLLQLFIQGVYVFCASYTILISHLSFFGTWQSKLNSVLNIFLYEWDFAGTTDSSWHFSTYKLYILDSVSSSSRYSFVVLLRQ